MRKYVIVSTSYFKNELLNSTPYESFSVARINNDSTMMVLRVSAGATGLDQFKHYSHDEIMGVLDSSWEDYDSDFSQNFNQSARDALLASITAVESDSVVKEDFKKRSATTDYPIVAVHKSEGTDFSRARS